LKRSDEPVGVVALLIHSDDAKNQLHVFLQVLPSWKLFLLNGIDLFIVLSVDFPLSKNKVSHHLRLHDGFQENGMLVHRLKNSTIYIKDEEKVLSAKVEPGTLFTCEGLRKDTEKKALLKEKGFSRFYVEGNAWYTYQLFLDHKLFLKRYNFFLKIDYDIFFFKPMYQKIKEAFMDENILFLHGGTLYNEKCSKRAREVSNSYLKIHNQTSKTTIIRAENSKGAIFTIQIPSSSDLYYGNFIGGKLGFFSSAHVLRYAKYMFIHGEYFKTRWTDQAYWHNALGIHAENLNRKIKSFEKFRFGRPFSAEPGSFIHTKNLQGNLLLNYLELTNKTNFNP